MSEPPAGTSTSDIDVALLQQLATGDTSGLGQLYDRHAEVVFAVILRVVRDRAAAEDLLQETFVRCWQRAGSFDPDRGQGRVWLVSIAHNLALNELRRRRRHPQDVPSGDDLITLAGTEPGPLAQAIAAQRRERLRAAIALLPPSSQAAVSLYAAGHSQSEIAAALDQPLGTIKSRLRRSLSELRQTLAPAGQVSNDV